MQSTIIFVFNTAYYFHRLALTPDRKRQLELKVLAEKLFKGKMIFFCLKECNR